MLGKKRKIEKAAKKRELSSDEKLMLRLKIDEAKQNRISEVNIVDDDDADLRRQRIDALKARFGK